MRQLCGRVRPDKGGPWRPLAPRWWCWLTWRSDERGRPCSRPRYARAEPNGQISGSRRSLDTLLGAATGADRSPEALLSTLQQDAMRKDEHSLAVLGGEAVLAQLGGDLAKGRALRVQLTPSAKTASGRSSECLLRPSTLTPVARLLSRAPRTSRPALPAPTG